MASAGRYRGAICLRGLSWPGAGAALGPAIAACGGTSPSPSATSGGPKRGGHLRVGVVGGSTTETLDAQTVVTEPDIAFSSSSTMA